METNSKTTIYILLALIAGILLGTYIPKMINTESPLNESGKVYQTVQQSPQTNSQNKESAGCRYDDQCPLRQKCSEHYPKIGACIPYSSN